MNSRIAALSCATVDVTIRRVQEIKHIDRPVHAELQILEHFLGFREVVSWSADGGKFDRKGGDHREKRAVFVPFGGRMLRHRAATGSNNPQLATFRGESVWATRSIERHHPATCSNSSEITLLTKGCWCEWMSCSGFEYSRGVETSNLARRTDDSSRSRNCDLLRPSVTRAPFRLIARA
jgi:hypothetical protein